MLSEAKCRDLVWERDQGRCRASGLWLDRSRGEGECHHLRTRLCAPELKRDPSNMILLSVANHRLAQGVWGGKLLKLLDPEHPSQPATNADKKILFLRVDRRGTLMWRRLG